MSQKKINLPKYSLISRRAVTMMKLKVNKRKIMKKKRVKMTAEGSI